MNLFVFSCVLISLHLTTSTDLCGAVRYQYSEMNLGERDDVPYSFQSGNICQRGCCTASMEQNFVRPALNVYKGISSVRFTRAYREIKAISEQFKKGATKSTRNEQDILVLFILFYEGVGLYCNSFSFLICRLMIRFP
eukprot:sb/3474430/